MYKAQHADRAAQLAKRHPKKRLLYRDEVLRRRVIADLSQGRTPIEFEDLEAALISGYGAGEVRTYARKREFNTSP